MDLGYVRRRKVTEGQDHCFFYVSWKREIVQVNCCKRLEAEATGFGEVDWGLQRLSHPRNAVSGINGWGAAHGNNMGKSGSSYAGELRKCDLHASLSTQ